MSATGWTPVDESAAAWQPVQQDSFWRTVYDRSGIGSLQKLTGSLSDWAKGKAEKAQDENLKKVAAGEQGNAIEAYSPRAGYDLLHHTAGLVSGFLEPKNVALATGTALANTNPFTGIPVDAALIAHGGYGVAKNASQALKGNPDAVESALLSGSEMVGGAAGAAGQVRAIPHSVTSLKELLNPSTPSPVAQPSRAGGASTPTTAVESSGPGAIAKTLGIVDPPPNQLLTKAIKPLASNTGWDAAIAKAAPDMKLAEADLGHPITSVDDALNAASVAKKALWKQYAAKLKSASTPQVADDLSETAGTSASIDGNQIADAMMKSVDARARLQRPELVDKVQKIADTYRRPMGLEEAEDFLQSANNDLHGYYAKNKVGRQVAQGDPEMGSTVAEADQLRDSLYAKLDELTGPGAADLKRRYGALSNVENELLRRKNVAARQQPESLAEQLSMARAYGKIAVGAARLSPMSMLEGTQSLAAAKWLKARGTTDAMITRAFSKLGEPTPVPTNVPAETNAGRAVAVGAGGLPTGTAEQ